MSTNDLEQIKAELKLMKKKGRFVVSLTYILDRLESIERDDCPNCTQIPVYTMESFPRVSQDVKDGEIRWAE